MKTTTLLASSLLLLTSSLAFADIPAATPVPQKCVGDSAGWLVRHTNNVERAKAGGAPVVFIGDWITDRWNHGDYGGPIFKRHFKDGPMKAITLASYNDRIENMIWRVENGELEGFEAKLVVLQAGLGNTGRYGIDDEPPADAIIGIKTLIDAVRRKQPKAKIVLHPVFPRASEDGTLTSPAQLIADVVNAEIWKFCDEKNVFWCDFTDQILTPDGRYPVTVSDGTQPRTLGYAVWASAILPYARAAVAGTDMPPMRFAAGAAGRGLAGLPEGTGFGFKTSTMTPRSSMENRFDMFYTRLRQHRKMISVNASKKYDIVFCGDSITHCWEAYAKDVYTEVTNRFSVLNLGYCGDGIQNLLWRLKYGEGQGYKAKLFMVMIGTNNPCDRPKDLGAGIVNIVKTIRELHPEAKVLLLPIFPRGEKANDWHRPRNAEGSAIAKAAFEGDPNVIWCDFNAKFLEPDGTLPKATFGDFLHPNRDGYRIWCDNVMPYFEKYAK